MAKPSRTKKTPTSSASRKRGERAAAAIERPVSDRRSASSGRPRLVDVAELAGVSLGSASRAISAPDSVRPTTLRRVQEAAERLGYVPDGAARALALRRSMTIGAVLPTINNPIFSDFVQALQKTLGRQGYHVLIATHEYDLQEEVSIVERLVQRGIDSLVLIGTDHPASVYRRIEQARLPYVCAWSIDESPGHPCVGISNRRAMHRVVRHLLELGHRDLAVISGDPSHNERARARIDGVLDMLSMAGLRLPPERLFCVPFSIDSGRDAMRRVLASHPRPTAVVCCTDLLATGALVEARAQHLTVPRDVSITGFDDIELASLLEPPLTSLRVRTDEIGRKAAELVLASLRGEAQAAPVEIETFLVVRGSTGPAPTL